MSALKKAKMCPNCRDCMPVGTEVKWVDVGVMRRDGAGRRHERTIKVPAHMHDCQAVQHAVARAVAITEARAVATAPVVLP